MHSRESRTRIQIAAVRQEHMVELLSLATACPESPHWPTEAWQSFVQEGDAHTAMRRVIFAARSVSGDMTGIIAVALLDRSTELELLLVHPQHRRMGIGRKLTLQGLAWSAEAGAQEAVLEVRASNKAAQELYRDLDFEEGGWRPRYYQRPTEDALLMRRVLAA